MATITAKNPAGKSAGDVDLHDDVFGITPNVPVMHQVVTAQLAARRAGTQSTKTRSEVRGGGAKPYRQKGTGRARQGSTNAPHFSGGGIALGPKPRSYSQRTPKKMIRLALRSALSDRAREDRIVVVDAWGWDTPSTKKAADALGALGVDGRVLVVIERDDATTALSFRNIPEVQIIHSNELNAYDVLCNDWIVFSKASISGWSGAARSEEEDAPKDAQPGVADAPVVPDEAFASAKATESVASSDTNTADDETESADAADDVTEAAEGSASDEADAARDQSEAEIEPAGNESDS